MQLNAFESNVVFCAWTGRNAMSADRSAALQSLMLNIGCPVVLLTPDTLTNWVLPEHPLHPAYPYLSLTHKADYLRVYMMRHYGGGYTDIKATPHNWRKFFNALQSSSKEVAGYTEIHPNGVAPVGGPLESHLREHYQQLIGLGAFIFKTDSPLAIEWLRLTHVLLDQKLEELRVHPARHPQDQTGAHFSDGTQSCYPLAWTEMLGNIFHPLILAHRDRVLHLNMAPRLNSYR